MHTWSVGLCGGVEAVLEAVLGGGDSVGVWWCGGSVGSSVGVWRQCGCMVVWRQCWRQCWGVEAVLGCGGSVDVW